MLTVYKYLALLKSQFWRFVLHLAGQAATGGESLNFTGILIGMIAFLLIGAFHPIVIKCEYYFGQKMWPLFLAGGLISCLCSILVSSAIFSALLAVLGFTMLWSILELKEQAKRVQKGWFPENPNKQEGKESKSCSEK